MAEKSKPAPAPVVTCPMCREEAETTVTRFGYRHECCGLHSWNGKPLVAYAAFAKHCGLYPLSPEVIQTHAEDLAGFELGKGTIRFRAEAPLKAALVRKIVKARIAEISG